MVYSNIRLLSVDADAVTEQIAYLERRIKDASYETGPDNVAVIVSEEAEELKQFLEEEKSRLGYDESQQDLKAEQKEERINNKKTRRENQQARTMEDESNRRWAELQSHLPGNKR